MIRALSKTINTYRLIWLAGKVATAVQSGDDQSTDNALARYREFVEKLKANLDEVGFINLYIQLQSEIKSSLPSGHDWEIQVDFSNVNKFRYMILEMVGIDEPNEVCVGKKVFAFDAQKSDLTIRSA